MSSENKKNLNLEIESLGELKTSEIVFNSDANNWVMKLTKEGIFFNRDRYPNSSPDQFAQAVIGILEKEFAVKFERTSPPYNREPQAAIEKEYDEDAEY